ncbi:amidohydrolase family protein [Prauserella flavalba]|uniref:amidohydrolase family protein n=1 Tax=Prauserella flavalba TaxID=1477506 RepID=UPI0036EC2943
MHIVDICEVAYDRDCWRAYLGAFAADAPRYLSVFARRLCDQAGADPGRYRETVERDPFSAVDLLVEPGRLGLDVGEHVERLSADGVTCQVVHGGMWKIPGGTVNDRVAALVDGRTELRFWAGISLKDASAAEREAVRSHRELGATGFSIIPFLDEADVLSEAFTPVFAYAERERLPVWIHCGQNFATARPVDSCSWWQLDRLAGRHPALRIVAGHGGWPWLGEMAAVAQRHQHVYLDSSTHRASAMRTPGYGWEPVLARVEGPLRRKVLFGSTTWVSGRSAGELAGEFAGLGLTDTALQAWLSGNASRLLEAGS